MLFVVGFDIFIGFGLDGVRFLVLELDVFVWFSLLEFILLFDSDKEMLFNCFSCIGCMVLD